MLIIFVVFLWAAFVVYPKWSTFWAASHMTILHIGTMWWIYTDDNYSATRRRNRILSALLVLLGAAGLFLTSYIWPNSRIDSP